MKQIVLLLFLLAASAAAGRIAPMAHKAEPKQAAEHQPKEVRVFFSEDRTDQPCAWLQ
jgi:hypothetical protein